jgi:3-hydroxyisobutyrate dehydrogenase
VTGRAGLRIGFVGLGIMGRPMARNLARAGHVVTGWSRTAASVTAVAEAGVAAGASLGETVGQADVVFTMLPDGPDVAAVAHAPDGILARARPGAIWIDASTIDPVVARTLAAEAAARGLRALDAPVSGGETGAVAGTLAIMVGGAPETFEAARPVLEALGGTVAYIGPAGHGQATKLCNQVIAALTLLAVSEGLLLAEREGLDTEAVVRAIGGGAATSWMLEHLGPRMLHGDYRAGFFVDLKLKDLRLVAEEARRLALPLPGTALCEQLFRAVAAAGGGRLGTQALITALRRLAARDEPEP